MQSLQELLITREAPKKNKTSERAEIIKSIYEVYSSPQQKIFRKKANWARYINYLKENRIPDSKENQAKFKKSKSFIKEHSVKTICYFISHIPTADLYYIYSQAKDYNNRNENFSAYFISSILKGEKSFPQFH